MTKLLKFFTILAFSLMPSLSHASDLKEPEFLKKMRDFDSMESAQHITGVWDKISFRAKEEPFLAIASVIFLLAILHTFFAIPITKYAHKVQHQHDEHIKKQAMDASAMPEERRMVSFKGTILHFFGEVEAVFGIWVVALIAVMVAFYDKAAVEYYIGHSVNYTEPLFVFVIMAIASTRPVLRFAESCMSRVAALGKNTPAAWWLCILIVAPILGSFITEPGAMTIAAMLLARKFYVLNPSPKFAYATLGLLFVNVSIGGVLTHFAAPPVIMVAKPWSLTTSEMFLHFGTKAMGAIVVSSLVYFIIFRKELKAMATNRIADPDHDGTCDWKDRAADIPLLVTISHLFFMAWTVLTAHTPGLFMGGFLFFLAFKKATQHHQNPIDLRSPILVGFFLAALVTHGGLQGWWLAPIIGSLTEWPLFLGATVLTGFNDNAAITFLASQVDGLNPALKYAVLAGAVTGGGLTVIANAPNPAGQSILSRFFGDGVSPLKLFLAALLPTFITIFFLKVIQDDRAETIFAMPAKQPTTETQAHQSCSQDSSKP